jgi:hypothetical protein
MTRIYDPSKYPLETTGENDFLSTISGGVNTPSGFGHPDPNTGIMDNNPFDDDVPDAVEANRDDYSTFGPDSLSGFFGSGVALEPPAPTGDERPMLGGGLLFLPEGGRNEFGVPDGMPGDYNNPDKIDAPDNLEPSRGLESSQGLESVLSPYVGPYVTELLGKGAALADSPYEAYMGPLTAGESDLQTKAFEGIAGLDIPTDKMGTFNVGTFDASQAEKYMNPYLMAALNPQLEEARRQSDIERQRSAGRLLQAGAFGGGRQAVMAAENQRNLLQNLSGITGEGYRDAYDKAMGQFNIEQDRGRGVQEDANRYGLAALEKIKQFGDAQRGITAEGVAADKAQFEEERDFPYNQIQYMQQLLSGLPLQTKNFTYTQPTGLEKATTDVSGIMTLINALRGQ